jgi:hypothetical protein
MWDVGCGMSYGAWGMGLGSVGCGAWGFWGFGGLKTQPSSRSEYKPAYIGTSLAHKPFSTSPNPKPKLNPN